jgi:hypothetical protein
MIRYACILILGFLCFESCFFKRESGKELRDEKKQFRMVSDDSTLYLNQSPRVLPYNRIIQTAGTEVVFGDPNYENHSLDCKILPDHTTLLVEDRYGILLIDIRTHAIKARFTYTDDKKFRGITSTFSGIKFRPVQDHLEFYWSAASGSDRHISYVMIASWDGKILSIKSAIPFPPEPPSPLALPNEVDWELENGIPYLYVVLNGNNQVYKIDLNTEKTVWKSETGVAPYGLCLLDGKVYVSNWAGPQAQDTLNRETAGVPYGKAYIVPRTGATEEGTLSEFDAQTGQKISELRVGLHPNALIKDSEHHLLYIACSNSDQIYVVRESPFRVIDSISVKLDGNSSKTGGVYFGDSPNALVLDSIRQILYIANGMDNAVAVVQLNPGQYETKASHFQNPILGFIPTGAYPGGLDLEGQTLIVTNLESSGAWVSVNGKIIEKAEPEMNKYGSEAFNSHHQLASVSIIPVPGPDQLNLFTEKVKRFNLLFRANLSRLQARENQLPLPVPLRAGEPSVFQHVLYIIKENRTYDQVLGDLPQGRGEKGLCIFGDSITPNQHALARQFLLMDNFYASGKCSAEGHQWADEGMVTDYVEKNVRSWFRSYPHVQTDALVYTPTGFIWNDALDHGKSVRIYGEASVPRMDKKNTWESIYDLTLKGEHFAFTNYSTISRVRPILSPHYPASDDHIINDVYRAQSFIEELKGYEAQNGDALPNLMVMALSNDHTVGVRPGFPSPRAMVADNDLALGKIIEAITHSRFYKNTVIFVMEDDSQAGWDHISAYRTTGFVISPYSRLKKTITTNYNQTSVVRTIEQILGIPPMNALDATALPMFDCFENKPHFEPFTVLKNKIPLNEMNPKLSQLKGDGLKWARISLRPEYDRLDQGDDDLLNQILWFASKGKAPYPGIKGRIEKD